MKQVILDSKDKLQSGLDRVADAVKLTIGPSGKNVAVDRFPSPLISNDGGTIAAEITLTDKLENIGAGIIKDVIKQTSDKVGGGRTASAILTQAIVQEGSRHLKNGANLQLLKQGMEEARLDIDKNLDKIAIKVEKQEQLEQIATISTENEELGKVIGELVFKTGQDSVVTVEESQVLGIQSETVDGLKLDRGWISPYMVTNPERMEAEIKDCNVLVTDKKISIFKEIYPLIEKIGQGGSLLVVAEDFDGDALNQAILMKLKGFFNLVAIKAPVISKNDWLEDISAITGTKIVSEHSGVKFTDVELGKAKKVIVSREDTVIMGSSDIETHINHLKMVLENSTNEMEKDRLKRRIAGLSGGVAIIKVGAATDSELKYLKQKIEDGVSEAKRALEAGIVPGGDCSFVNATKSLQKRQGIDEVALGYNIVLESVLEPFKQILRNAGIGTEVILNQIQLDKSLKIGYNVVKKELTDMIESGIVDALKVSKTVLQNAISGASMFLSISGAVIDDVKDKE